MEDRTETRWLVLCGDGRHSTLGRHRDPDEDDINRAEDALNAQGLGGWLVLLKGQYFDLRHQPTLMMIRPLGKPVEGWEKAASAFEIIRKNVALAR